MRSRESPKNFFENEACVLFQGSKTSVRFCGITTRHASFPPPVHICVHWAYFGDGVGSPGQVYTCTWRFGAQNLPCYSVRIAHHEARCKGSCTELECQRSRIGERCVGLMNHACLIQKKAILSRQLISVPPLIDIYIPLFRSLHVVS
jgi:hypothetical protein